MINTCKATRKINSFKYVAIPSPRDVFAKFGERVSSRGEYSTTAGVASSPSMVSASSVIDQMINAENLLKSATDSQPQA